MVSAPVLVERRRRLFVVGLALISGGLLLVTLLLRLPVWGTIASLSGSLALFSATVSLASQNPSLGWGASLGSLIAATGTPIWWSLGESPDLAMLVWAGVAFGLWFVFATVSVPGPRLGALTFLGLGTLLTVSLEIYFGRELGFLSPPVLALATTMEVTVVLLSRKTLVRLKSFAATLGVA